MIQAVPHPAIHGRIWLREGALLYRRSALSWGFVMGMYTFLMACVAYVVLQLSIAGPLLFTAANACFFVSFLHIAKTSQSHTFFSLHSLFSGFSSHIFSYIFIGLIEGGILLMIFTIWRHTDPVLQQILQHSHEGLDPQLTAQLSGRQLLLFLGVAYLTKWLFTYAYGLIAFYGIPPVKALVFSFIGALRNWRPWLLFAIGLLSLIFTPYLILVVISFLFPTVWLFIPYAMILYFICVALPVIYSSVYISLVDVYRLDDPAFTPHR